MRLFYTSLCFLFGISLYAQNSKEFTRVNEFYIRGNTQVIGNNNLSKHKSKPIDATDEFNDETKMKYVDIDDAITTYNSSSANLTIPEGASIKYAALYWTATYPTEKGTKVAKGNRYVYKQNGDPTHDVQEVQLKIPGGSYIPIRGDLIYDGKQGTVKGVTSSRPYTCYKDITNLIKDNQTINGTYIVANIAATQGYISGGSSAGWMLYVIYENDKDPLQYITTYNGFNHVNKKGVEINFGNFKAPEKTETKTALTVSALEGDSTLKKDQIAIYYPEEQKYVTLDNGVRASDNFFNSSITIDNTYYTDRTPNSKNTLGFDIAKVTVPNEINTSIANNNSGFKLQFKTRADRYYIYFVAFQTTLNKSTTDTEAITSTTETKEEKEEEIIEVVEVVTLEEPREKEVTEVVEISTPKEIEVVEEKEEVAIPQEKPEEPKITPKEETTSIDDTLVKIIDKKPTKVPDVLRGYYIISNVFSSKTNAEKWANKLKGKNIQSNIFRRPENNFYYVSIGNNEDPVLLYEVLKKMRKDQDLKDAWILKINIQ
ncbi:SPOR domain-containing protein [uncultured Dokdonia sp.]|uniref:SPOR domain-containing protein n=1 Tax=uncultured Dokdonia sp. TaxID=575653 RepID=UPI002626AB45|nr:SPOR domain-containing protein [uncultured Dokdonia sp.]